LQGTHLFINVRYKETIQKDSAEAIVDFAVMDSFLILSKLLQANLLADHKSVCISFFAKSPRFPWRIFRLSATTSNILTVRDFMDLLCSESSIISSQSEEIESEIAARGWAPTAKGS